jgi:hypothetical protein
MKKILQCFLLTACLAPFTVQAYLGTPDHPEEIDRIDEGEEPVIKPNQEDPSYDVWKHVRDDISEG